jgi:hypothetical protein
MQKHPSLKISFLAVFSFALAMICSCKPAPKPVSEEEAYALLNEVILEDSLIMRDVYYRFSGFTLSDEMKKEFTPDEAEFMEKQIYDQRLRSKEVKPNKIVWFHRNYEPGDFVKLIHRSDSTSFEELSFPIISPDRKKLLIHRSFDCNCMLGGSGGDDLYVKKNGRWHLAKTFNGWIS